MKAYCKPPVITIDGASGTGKGTIAQRVAQVLGWNLLDSGALYRVLALAAQKHSVSLQNEPILALLAEHLDVQFLATETTVLPTIILEGQEVTHSIRTEAVGNAASQIAVFPTVRQALLSRQRSFRELPGLVTDGRDMGTVIFPDAELKIFLVASLKERVNRRYKQLKTAGIHVNLAGLEQELEERDKRDQQRAVSPLIPAKDAVVIDTDQLTIEQVLDRIMSKARKVFSEAQA